MVILGSVCAHRLSATRPKVVIVRTRINRAAQQMYTSR